MENKINPEQDKGTSNLNFFAGSSIPKNYDDYLGPIVFTPYALDLAARMNVDRPVKVLELACGTGLVTRHIIQNLPKGSELIATDISQDMIAIAKENVAGDDLDWRIVAMETIPFADATFDIIICQFGLMFVPDKLKALSEMRRTLKKGGRLLINTWGEIAENPLFEISFRMVKTFIGELPFQPEMNPFSLTNETQVLELLALAGFEKTKSEKVRKITAIKTADLAAKSFLLTSPVMAKRPELYAQMLTGFKEELSEKWGKKMLPMPMLALVFEAQLAI